MVAIFRTHAHAWTMEKLRAGGENGRRTASASIIVQTYGKALRDALERDAVFIDCRAVDGRFVGDDGQYAPAHENTHADNKTGGQVPPAHHTSKNSTNQDEQGSG